MLTTLEGHYLRSMVLESRRLQRHLEAEGAARDAMSYFGLVEAAFGAAVAQLGRGRFGPDQLQRFAEDAAAWSRRLYAVTADEVSRSIRYEFGDQVAVNDIGGRLELAAKTAVIATNVRRRRLGLNDLDNLIRNAELLAEEWGFDATPYRPEPLARLGLVLAQARWSVSQLRRGRQDERPAALPRHSRAR
ncbi:hypothetical protein [Micromonospora sp. NPDC049679]|uniref:hypothetical protein n=1 Tax=Micromonospora sp. NPDC049679 TaxID=3155920 RepID=UPI00340C5FBB